VSFTYDSSNNPIIENLSVAFAPGWTGLVGANGCGKSTLLKLLSGGLIPTAGEMVGKAELSYHCRQETTAAPAEFDDFCAAYDKDAINLKSSLGLHELVASNWTQLSQGEQKRFQLGCALWSKPDLLLVDEPTNHLDAKNREFLIAALSQYKGIGILVSHDRALLNVLCEKCLFFVGGKIHLRAGNYDQAKSALDAQFAHSLQEREQLKEKAASLQQEVTRLAQVEQASAGRLSKSKVHVKDRDTKAKIDGARLTGKDASFGQKKITLASRIAKMADEVDDLAFVKSYAGAVSFSVASSPRKVLLHMKESLLLLPNGQRLTLPELVIRSEQKIGVMGANGVGKTTLIRCIIEQHLAATHRYYFLTQELSINEIQHLKTNLAALDKAQVGRCLQIISRLGSDAKQILKSDNWSSGEARKVAIALAIIAEIPFLILDEPTNHLDLPSIQNLEQALAESNLTLLMISHDAAFIGAVCTEIWQIEKHAGGTSCLEVRENK
jgi:ATPase subunit of ABC transporter with duplicated ATPase domains